MNLLCYRCIMNAHYSIHTRYAHARLLSDYHLISCMVKSHQLARGKQPASMSLLRPCAVLVMILSLQTELGQSTKGVDVSTYVSESNCACLKRSGYDFLIVRAYRSTGEPDPNAPGTIANCKAAGFQYLDVYLFPCPKCGKSASQQVSEMGKSPAMLRY